MNHDAAMAHQDAVLKSRTEHSHPQNPRNPHHHHNNNNNNNNNPNNPNNNTNNPPPPNPPYPPSTPDLSSHHPSSHHHTSPTTFTTTLNPVNPPTPVPFPLHAPLPLQDSHLPPPAQSKWRVTPAQKDALLKAFDEEPYPELSKKVALAEQLGVTNAQISKWFQHRRESLTRIGQFKAQYNRTRRTPEELDVLQTAFEEDRYPTAERLAQLEAQLTGVTAKQIKLWFKHRRKQVQKRNRASTSPSLTPASQPHLSMHPSNPNAIRVLRPDLAASAQDPMRPDWRSAVGSVGVMPTMPQPHPVPSPTGVVQTTTQPALPYPFDQHYYSYKGPPIMLAPQSQLSELELMALRGALAVTDSAKPSQEGILRLSQMLNRPHNIITEWFRSQEPIRQPDVVTDVSQQPFMQSPALTDHTMTRPYSTGHASPQLQDYRKSEGDMPMTAVQDKSMNTSSMSPKIQNGRDQDTNRAFHHLDVKSAATDPNAGQKPLVGKNEITSTNMIPQGSSVTLSTYMYPNGLGAVDGNVVMPHQAAMFHTNQGSSAPMLAPLRYMPTNPPGQTYIPSNTVWYQQPQAFSK